MHTVNGQCHITRWARMIRHLYLSYVSVYPMEPTACGLRQRTHSGAVIVASGYSPDSTGVSTHSPVFSGRGVAASRNHRRSRATASGTR